MTEILLDIERLSVTFHTPQGDLRAVDDVSLQLREGEILGLVGESGSGKSVAMQAAMRLLAGANVTVAGRALFRGRDLLTLEREQMRRVRGAEIAMIFQDPMSALNPVHRVGWQIVEQLRVHRELSRQAARRRAIELLKLVGIANAERRVDDYPHEFSGGMRQRVMIAMALSNDPSLLIADEPTTALDVTIQAQIIELIARLRSELGAAVILITHDMGVVAEVADRVAVMYAGRIAEQGPTREVFYDPQHPYTWGLLGSIPRIDRPRPSALPTLPGQVPLVTEAASRCQFGPRCRYAFARCGVERPELTARAGEERHEDACFLAPTDKRELRRDALAGAA